MENQILDVKKVAALANSGKIDAALKILGNVTDKDVLLGIVSLADHVSDKTLSTIQELYVQDFLTEREHIKSDIEIIRDFNSKVDSVMSQIDLKDDKTIKNFEGFCKSLRINFESAMQQKTKKTSLFQRIFGINKG